MERSGRNWAPPNPLFPDPPALRNNIGQARDDHFPSGSRPPWQTDRNEFGSNPNPRPESPPWSRHMSDSKIKDFQDWYNRRPGTGAYNDLNKNMSPGGWEKQPSRNNQGGENNTPWRNDEPALMDRRGSGRDEPWNNRPLSDRGDWAPMGANRPEPGFRSFGPSESNQMDRFGPSSASWGGDSPSRLSRPRDPDWKEAQRYPNFRERPQEPGWYGGSKAPLLGLMEERGPRQGPSWDAPRDRPKQDDWNPSLRKTDAFMKNHPDNMSSNVSRDRPKQDDWNPSLRPTDAFMKNNPDNLYNLSRDFDNGRWINRPETNESDHYNYGGEPRIGDRNKFYEWDDRQPGGAEGMPDRDFGRKRGRYPEQDVWSRLESHGNDLPMMKKPRIDDHPKSLMGDDVMAMIQQERMQLDLQQNNNPPFELFPQNVDLRHKLVKQDAQLLSKERRSIQVIICPLFKRSKFRINDLDKIRDQLTTDLYAMAGAEDVENLPQLRFENWVAGRSGIYITCHDVTSAKWLLNWKKDHRVRIPVRNLLSNDTRQLALIGFDIKGTCDLNSESVKNVLKIQNPGLDTSLWVDFSKKVSKKGKVYVYQVDGHSLRSLVARKWELFFDMQKVFIRRFRTNFTFDPLEFELFT